VGELKMGERALPPLQSEIIRLLGERGALTKHEAAKELGKAYKNILFSFDSLKEKGLIEVVGEKEYRNQKFETYWLTWKGVLEAYALGISLEKLKLHVFRYIKGEITPEIQSGINAIFDFLRELGPERSRAFINCLDFSKQPPTIKYLPFDLISGKEAEKIIKILSKYELYKNVLEKMLKEISKIVSS